MGNGLVKKFGASITRSDEPTSLLERSAELNRELVNEKDRTAPLSFSSQESVQDRFFGPPTILLHEARAVDFGPIRTMGSALVGHQTDLDSIVGPIRSVTMDEGERKGRAVIGFDDDATGNRAFSKVKSGSLRGVSVRFSVDKSVVLDEGQEWESPGGQRFVGGTNGLEIATRWTPREISLTPVPADTGVGVGRTGKKETPMEFTTETLAALASRGLTKEMFGSEDAAKAAIDALDARDAAAREAQDAADKTAATVATVDAERAQAELAASNRTLAFARLAERSGDPKLLTGWINDKTSLDAAREQVFDLLAKRQGPPVKTAGVDVGMAARTRLEIAATGAMCSRAGVEFTPPKDFADTIPPSVTYLELARNCLAASGETVKPFEQRESLLQRALTHVSGDFTKILSNVRDKSLQKGWEEAPTTYQHVSSAGTMDDFKVGDRPNLGEFQDYELVLDGAPLPEGTVADQGESVQLRTYGRGFNIGRQALISDDQSAFGRTSRMFGQSAARTINKLHWDHVTLTDGVGPTMSEDAKALFATDHPSGASYVVGATILVDNTGLAAVRVLLRSHLGLTGSANPGVIGASTMRTNTAGVFLVVPAALEQAAEELVNGIYVPVTQGTAQINVNRQLQIVVEPYLDGATTDGATAWYLYGNPNTVPIVEVARLAGQTAPVVESMTLIEGLGVRWQAYFDVDVQALNHRGVVKSKGAA